MIVQHPTTWKRPSRSVSRVNDGGEGAYPLIPGCYVTRGPDAPEREKKKSKAELLAAELEKAEAERIAPKLAKAALSSDLGGSSDLTSAAGAAEEEEKAAAEKAEKEKEKEEAEAKARKDDEEAAAAELERPETEIGVVEEIISWEGVAGAGRRVRWLHDDSVEECRWGASDRFDILAIEPNKDKDAVKKVLPLPETRETVAKRRHFGQDTVRYGVLLRVRASATLNADPSTADGGGGGGGGGGGDEWQSVAVDGTLELPDFGAMVYVTGERWPDNSLKITERKLLAGSADSGWTPRFGQNAWRPGTEYELAPAYGGAAETESGGVSNEAQRVLGSYSYKVSLAGESVEVNGDVELCTGTLFTLDPHMVAPSITISENGCSASCTQNDPRGLAFGTVGFARGVHYWEVKIEQAEMGSIFLGVAEKGVDGKAPRLTRWQGWGVINYRASFHNNTERVYGDHFKANDTVGLRLDMDKGKLSVFLDGMKYGEHMVSDLGVAYEGLTSHRERVRPRTLWPVVGFRRNGDKVTITRKWLSSPAVHAKHMLGDAVAVSNLLAVWGTGNAATAEAQAQAAPQGAGAGAGAGAAAGAEEGKGDGGSEEAQPTEPTDDDPEATPAPQKTDSKSAKSGAAEKAAKGLADAATKMTAKRDSAMALGDDQAVRQMLWTACEEDDVAALEQVAEAGPDLGIEILTDTNHEGSTAVHVATENGAFDVVEWLTARASAGGGAALTSMLAAKDQFEYTPFFASCENGEAVRFESGSSATDSTLLTPYTPASKAHHLIPDITSD